LIQYYNLRGRIDGGNTF